MMRGMDSEEMMSAAVELGTEVTAEDICYEENYLCYCFYSTRTQYRVFYTMV
jgi:hypothetical protein